jgi:hypothetical protein
MFGKYIAELFATPERILLALIFVIAKAEWFTHKAKD